MYICAFQTQFLHVVGCTFIVLQGEIGIRRGVTGQSEGKVSICKVVSVSGLDRLNHLHEQGGEKNKQIKDEIQEVETKRETVRENKREGGWKDVMRREAVTCIQMVSEDYWCNWTTWGFPFPYSF